MAMIAIRKRGPKKNLPPKLQEVEFPNVRKLLTETEIVVKEYFQVSVEKH